MVRHVRNCGYRIVVLPLVLAVLLLSLYAATGLGQTGGNASLYGTVTDSSGAVVPGVKITATNSGTNVSWTTVSDNSGNYVIPDLPIGQYKVNAERSSFASFEVAGVTVAVAQVTRVDIVMQLGATKQAVTVSASGPPLISTNSPGLAVTIGQTFINELPLLDRDIFDLEILAAGTGRGGPGNLTVNGVRQGHNEYELNGLTLNDPQFTQLETTAVFPNVDAIEEFTLITNGYQAQYGRDEGGQELVATRSGTNQFHGTAYEYFRNNALDARSFFATSTPPFRRNLFGGNVGGPIRKDRLFFFASYQGERINSTPNAGVQNTVPTEADRNGDLSDVGRPIIDPTTGQSFPGNVIPMSRLSSITEKLLSGLVPLPNGPGGALIYSPANVQADDQGIAKIDAVLSSKDHLSGTLFLDRTTHLTNSGLPKLFDSVSTPTTEGSINETHNFTPDLLNDFTVGGVYYGYAEAPSDVGGPYTMADFGTTYFIPPGGDSLSLSVAGNVGAMDGVPSIRNGQQVSLKNNLEWIKGNHLFVFGGSVNLQKTWTQTLFLQAGGFSFNGFATGDGLGDLMLGLPASFSQYASGYLPHSAKDLALYAQDTWRARRSLTLDVGLRYAPTFYETSLNNQNSNFIPGEQSTVFPTAPKGLVYQGDSGVDGRNFHSPYWDVFEPRVGVAWMPFGNSKWLLKSSFGVYHLAVGTFSVDNNLSWPFTLTTSLLAPPSFANPWQGQTDPFPFNPVQVTAPLAERQTITPPPPGLEPGDFISTDSKIPTSLQWNFAVEHTLGINNSIEIAYAGGRSYREYYANDPNAPVYIPGLCDGTPCSTQANINSRRPYGPALGEVLVNYPFGFSNYNALQITYEHKMGHGLTLLANYTWSKTMNLGESSDQQFGQITNPHDVFNDYGPINYDHTHVLKWSYAWNLPWFASARGITRQLASGWIVSGVAQEISGDPLTIYSGVNNSLSGYGNDRADQVGDWHLPGGRSRNQEIQEWFNPAAFTVNAIGTFGNIGLNNARGPAGLTWDMAFFKTFSLSERFKLQYRLDGSNIFNHTVLGDPNTIVVSPRFGQIGSTGGPRVLQMSLRVIF